MENEEERPRRTPKQKKEDKEREIQILVDVFDSYIESINVTISGEIAYITGIIDKAAILDELFVYIFDLAVDTWMEGDITVYEHNEISFELMIDGMEVVRMYPAQWE